MTETHVVHVGSCVTSSSRLRPASSWFHPPDSCPSTLERSRMGAQRRYMCCTSAGQGRAVVRLGFFVPSAITALKYRDHRALAANSRTESRCDPTKVLVCQIQTPNIVLSVAIVACRAVEACRDKQQIWREGAQARKQFLSNCRSKAMSAAESRL